MTPEQIASLNVIVALLSQLGKAPIIVIIGAVILAPWVILTFVSIAQHRRFEAVVKMYENNFAQVENITKLAKGYRETLVWATSEATETRSAVVNNMHCPIVRKNAKPRDFDNE